MTKDEFIKKIKIVSLMALIIIGCFCAFMNHQMNINYQDLLNILNK